MEGNLENTSLINEYNDNVTKDVILPWFLHLRFPSQLAKRDPSGEFPTPFVADTSQFLNDAEQP